MSPDDQRHGTNAGYMAHRAAGVAPCPACRKAASDYERQRFYDAHLGRPRLIDATGSKRRIQALLAIGWPTRIICAELGYAQRAALSPLLYNATWVTRTQSERIAELYERLCMTPGPSGITRSRALRAGYAPPLAWDDIDNDERPTIGRNDCHADPVVVERILAGDWALARAANKAERAEVVRRWRAAGWSTNELGRLTGWEPHRYIEKDEEAA